jgi:uncharacterized protein
MDEKLQKIREIVEKELSCNAHDMEHIMRVFNTCTHLAEGEDVDMEVIQAAALLHDIARIKEDVDNSGNTDHALLGAEMAAPILRELGFPEDRIKHIQECIKTHRYRTGIKPETTEAKIVFDADKIDGVGATGVARGFIWTGKNNARFHYKPDLEEYAKENLGGKINGRIQDKTKHCQWIEINTKLKFLPDKMQTKKGRELCKRRVEYQISFMDRMEREINGEL